jgi:hypothetical protein
VFYKHVRQSYLLTLDSRINVGYAYIFWIFSPGATFRRVMHKQIQNICYLMELGYSEVSNKRAARLFISIVLI